MRKVISFTWLVLRILIYMIILLILLDDPILYPICVILFAYIEFKDKVYDKNNNSEKKES